MSFFPIIIRPEVAQTVPLTTADQSSKLAPKNPEEDYFYWYYLDKYFPNKFKRNYLIGSYTPDFLYIDERQGLYIDVECDEPYIYGTGTPTHYRDSTTEIARNKFFAAHNCFVVRFAEEQIVKYPLSCCLTIAKLIASFINNDVILKNFSSVVELPSIPQWNETEAKQLANINYRDTYLKSNFNTIHFPDRTSIIEGLKSFVNVENDAQVKEIKETWALPIAERVELGRAIAPLEIIAIENNLVTLKCIENISKFAPGDRLWLNPNNPFDKSNSYECILEKETDNSVTVSLTRYGAVNNLTIGSKWVLDQPLIDLRQLLIDPLNQLPSLPSQYETIMGILEGKISPNIPDKLIDLSQISQLGLLAKQEEALVKALATQNYYLIQGPPGTGKTWLLAHLAHILATQGQTILITAFTHTAINNALRKIVQVTGYNRVIKVGDLDKTVGLTWEGGEVRNYDKLSNSPYKNNTEGLIIGATCYAAGGSRLQNFRSDIIIFDEAGQITLPIAIRGMMYGERYIFIGDHQQMSPVIAGRHRQQWVTRSIFETLFHHTPGTMLDVTHRMNQEINQFPSEYFYQGKLQCSPAAANRRLITNGDRGIYGEVFDPDYPSIFYQVDHHRRTTSSREEAEVVVGLIFEAIACGISINEIAVVVPYRAQARLIRQKLQQLASKTKEEKYTLVQVDTVESMQGQERDVMIVSLTTSDPIHAAQKAEFYFKLNRLNVAITRSRVKRIVVGSPTVFTAQPQEEEYQKAVKCFSAFYQSCFILPKLNPQPITLITQPLTGVEMTIPSLFKQLSSLADDASKTDVTYKTGQLLLKALGFQDSEIKINFPTGEGKQTCDFAVFKPSPKYGNKPVPFALLHLEGRQVSLDISAPQYKKAVATLTQDLLGPNSRSITWGIISNSRQIQLFRKHGKVVHPASKIYELDTKELDSFSEIITTIKTQIDNPPSALTVAIYNNKGGVGKTTTTVNLAGILTLLGHKVLVLDLDCNQEDLTASLGVKPGAVTLYQALDSNINNNQVHQARVTYEQKIGKEGKKYSFDIIPSDTRLVVEFDTAVRENISFRKLSQILQPLRYEYDYILIDTPPNWTFFSQSSLYAADVVLIPTQQNNINSFTNAAIAIQHYLSEIHEKRQDYKPVALPIFLNAATKISDVQIKAFHDVIDKIIKQNINLLPYFYPKLTKVNQNREIFELRENAYVIRASFLNKPAVYCYQQAIQDYKALAKEYFIHE